MKMLFAAALLVLMIGGSIGNEKLAKGINELREDYAKENKITLNPVTNPAKLNEMAKKNCDQCPERDQIKPIAGYKVYPIYTGGGNIDTLFKGVFRYPETKEFGYCTNDSCKHFSALYIVNSGIRFGSFLTFLMVFVMIFRGI